MSRNSGKRPRKKTRRKGGSAAASVSARHPSAPWTFLSNHAHALICLAQEPDIRLKDVATRIGITERAVQKIVTDLEAEGLVTRYRQGRRNSYELDLSRPLRHPIEMHKTVGELVSLILD